MCHSPFIHISFRLFAKVIADGNHQGFHCIVFSLCSTTLCDVMARSSGLMPLPSRHIREIGHQLLSAVQCTWYRYIYAIV